MAATETKDLIRIERVQPTLSVNYEELKKALQEHVSKYKGIVVTGETVSDARKVMAELNSYVKIIDERRLEEKRKILEPVNEFDKQMKELSGLYTSEREAIKRQVEQFDDRLRDKLMDQLEDERMNMWAGYNVRPEFQQALIDDLVKVSNATKHEKLTGAARDKLEARVRDDKAAQDRHDLRIAQLATVSYEARLRVPLDKSHVQSFLNDPDEVYQAKLQEVVDREVQRQIDSDQRLREEQERKEREAEAARKREEDRKARAEMAAQSTQEPATPSAPEPAPADPEPAPTPPDAPETPSDAPTEASGETVKWWVVATYAMEADASMTKEELVAGERAFLTEAGLSQIANVTAHKAGRGAS